MESGRDSVRIISYSKLCHQLHRNSSAGYLKLARVISHKILAIVDFLTEFATDLNQRNIPKAKLIDFICTIRLNSRIMH